MRRSFWDGWSTKLVLSPGTNYISIQLTPKALSFIPFNDCLVRGKSRLKKEFLPHFQELVFSFTFEIKLEMLDLIFYFLVQNILVFRLLQVIKKYKVMKIQILKV